jgi:hypothetical protein
VKYCEDKKFERKNVMKRKLTGDGQQFYQYQQNEQSPLTSNCKKKTMTHEVGNPGFRQA